MRPGFRSWSRWFAVAAILLAAAWLSLLVWNRSRFDLNGFERNAEHMLARTDALIDHANNFNQDTVLASLPPNRFAGPVFRFDERYTESALSPATAATPASLASPAAVSLEFNGDDRVSLEATGDTPLEISGGTLKVVHRKGHFLRTREPLQVDWPTLGKIEIRARTQLGENFVLMLAKGMMVEPMREWSPEVGTLSVNTIPDGQFHTYEIEAETALEHQYSGLDRIQRIFLTPSSVEGDAVEIDYIRFIPRKREFAQARAGRSLITIAREARHVLFSWAPETLSYLVPIPRHDAVMRFGLGVLESDDPVSFRVGVEEDGVTRTVFRRTIDSNDAWHDHEVDLSRWAGREVIVRLAVDSDDRNVGFWSNPLVHGAPPERMNVVVILEDTLRADHLSAYGYERETSPALDAMADQGVLFEAAFAPGTETRVTCPSLMTSLLPTATGVWNFKEKLADPFLTLPEVLRSQGFATAAFVQNNQAGAISGLHQGYDHFFDEFSIGEGPARLYDDRMYGWLDRHRDRNFFLYLHLMDPHDPYEPPAEFDVWKDDVPPGTPEGADGGYALEKSRYDGEILHNDHYFDRFLARLDELGLRDDTLIVFTSDHGEYFGEHGLELHVPPAYTEVLHVPLVMSLPARLPAGLRLPAHVSLIDVMPTVLDLAGISSDRFLMQGDSLLPLIDSPDDPAWNDRVVFAEDVRDCIKGDPVGWGALFHGDWQAVNSRRYIDGTGKSPRGLLPMFASMRFLDRAERFHPTSPDLALALDPFLKRRVHFAMLELQELNQEIWRQMTRDALSEASYDSQTIARLRDLGYID